MAITITERDERLLTTDGNDVVTNSWSATVGRGGVFVCCVCSGTVLVTPTFTDARYAWVREGAGTQSTFAVACWAAPIAGNTSAGTFTGGYGADPHTGFGVTSLQLESVNEADIVRQVKFGNNAGAGTTPAITFDAPTLATCGIIGFLHNSTNPFGSTQPAGYTENTDSGYATPTTGFHVVSHASPGSVSTVTWGGTSATAWRGMIVEINHAVSLPTRPSFAHMLVR